MSKTVIIGLLVVALVVVILLVTVNVTKCDNYTGPFGFLRFSACTQAPIINPSG